MSTHLSRRWFRSRGKKGNHGWTASKWRLWLRRYDDRADADLHDAEYDMGGLEE